MSSGRKKTIQHQLSSTHSSTTTIRIAWMEETIMQASMGRKESTITVYIKINEKHCGTTSHQADITNFIFVSRTQPDLDRQGPLAGQPDSPAN
jgi:hypothetical protein